MENESAKEAAKVLTTRLNELTLDLTENHLENWAMQRCRIAARDAIRNRDCKRLRCALDCSQAGKERGDPE